MLGDGFPACLKPDAVDLSHAGGRALRIRVLTAKDRQMGLDLVLNIAIPVMMIPGSYSTRFSNGTSQ